MKDKRKTLGKDNVIYKKINCKDYEAIYIVETGKELSKRITKQQNAVARRDQFRHTGRTGHIFDWDVLNVLRQETNAHRRKLMESFFTPKKPTCNQ